MAAPSEQTGVQGAGCLVIVGMGCRLPGGINSPTDLWEFLLQGRSALSQIPLSRFNQEAFHHPDSTHPGSISSPGGYFVSGDLRAFDNEFFGINNLEAQFMDPQQRQLLEVAFECLESAGISLDAISNKPIGCYVANFTADYAIIQAKDPDLYHRYSGTGMGAAILANRISHVFNLTGPSLTIDTACSGSIYALHLACNALRNGECDGAIVAGANLIQSPELYIGAVKAGMTSSTAACHTFDLTADGYARAEGIGALYIKRLEDAIRDRDLIRSVIRGTAVNSNGKTNGISLPSVSGQEQVIRQCYERAGIQADRTDYIEAHGTGTEVGDAIEVEAFSRVIRHSTGRPVKIGALKPNLGHSEAVSGISSIIKVTMALENGLIPQTIGISHINPKLKLTERNVEIVLTNERWPSSTLRRASINSFGYGGSNGHLVLENFHGNDEQPTPAIPKTINSFPILFNWSANSSAALEARRDSLSVIKLEANRLHDLAYTLSCRRSYLPYRTFAIYESQPLGEALRPLIEATSSFSNSTSFPFPFVFVFTGQGSQWAGMGRALASRFRLFSEAIEELSGHLAQVPNAPERNLRDMIFKQDGMSRIDQSSVSHPACTAIQVALVQLLNRLQIWPTCVVGHSSGEIAAAYAAGQISAKEAILIAYYRGLAVSDSNLKGGMAAVGLGEEHARTMVREVDCEGGLELACINSPNSVTVSGDAESIDACVRSLTQQGVFARRLQTGGKPYHSRHMRLVGPLYEKLLAPVFEEQEEVIPKATPIMISSIYEREARTAELRSPHYWRENLESAVRFSGALTVAISRPSYLIEIGPHSTLKSSCVATLAAQAQEQRFYSATMSRGHDSSQTLLELVGQLFLNGYDRPLRLINDGSMDELVHQTRQQEPKVLPDLPLYRWERKTSLWSESRLSYEYRHRKHFRHELLGTLIPGSSGQMHQWRNNIRLEDISWLSDHKLQETVVFPAAGYIAMAIEALIQTEPHAFGAASKVVFQSIKFLSLLTFDNSAQVELFTELRPFQLSSSSASASLLQFTVSSFSYGSHTTHARGLIHYNYHGRKSRVQPAIQDKRMQKQPSEVWYKAMFESGLNFGPSFRQLIDIRTHPDRHTMAAIRRGDYTGTGPGSAYAYHPVEIDSLLQASIISTAEGRPAQLLGKIPKSIEHLALEPSRSPYFTINAISTFTNTYNAMSDVLMKDQAGTTVVEINGLQIVPWKRHSNTTEGKVPRQPIMEITWKPDISSFTAQNIHQLSSYLEHAVQSGSFYCSDECHAEMAAVLDLFCHKYPGSLRVLQLTPFCEAGLGNIRSLLHLEDGMARAWSLHTGHWSSPVELDFRRVSNMLHLDGNKECCENELGEFDIVLVPSIDTLSAAQLGVVQTCLSKQGKLIATSSRPSSLHLPLHNWADQGRSFALASTSDSALKVNIYTKAESITPAPGSDRQNILLLHDSHALSSTALLKHGLSQRGYQVYHVNVQELTGQAILSGCLVVSLLELHSSVMRNLGIDVLSAINWMVQNASAVLWLQSGGLMSAGNPDMALSRGLVRTLAMEHPSLRISIFDVGEATAVEINDVSISHVDHIIRQILTSEQHEGEYLQEGDILHVGRFSPVKILNERFSRFAHGENVPRAMADIGASKLAIQDPGRFETLHFREDIASCSSLESSVVEVQAKAVSINAKDFYMLRGVIDTRDATCSLDFSGVVTRVGAAVQSLQPGDRVVGMAPNRFQTLLRVPEWSCVKMLDSESFEDMASLPIVFATALYALHYRAHIGAGATVLVHSAAGGAGLAAIQIARRAGSRVFATVGTAEKREFLVQTAGLASGDIFSSRDASFLGSILEATDGRGVDVVFNSLTGDLPRASFDATADFGKFVDISKKDSTDNGRLDMKNFSRNVGYEAFDLADLYYSTEKKQREIWRALLEETVHLYRSGAIRVVEPLEVFDISDVGQAFQRFGSPERMGKIVISLRDEASQVKYLPPKYSMRFSEDKSYFLVGCLGGLGKVLSQWMVEQGARYLTFLGRTGASRKDAQEQVTSLELAGACVDVVKGDVSSLEDVQKALSAIRKPIGGIIHAAMNLEETLFASQMTVSKWKSCIEPKVEGAWNLHKALEQHQARPDFFLLTSSVASSVGLATESNYCAANSFLDHFARYRNSRGLPAVSVGLGIVKDAGYLHENPLVEDMLLRKGIQPYGEAEVLQIIDIALSHGGGAPSGDIPGADRYGGSHLVTGLELPSLQEISRKGFAVQSQMLNDPRLGLLAQALEHWTRCHASKTNDGKPTLDERKRQLQGAVAACASKDDTSAAELAALVSSLLAEAFANLLLLPADSLGTNTPLSSYGMDSMLATEFRAAAVRTVGVDVSFSALLEDGKSIADIVGIVVEKLLQGGG